MVVVVVTAASFTGTSQLMIYSPKDMALHGHLLAAELLVIVHVHVCVNIACCV